MNKVYSDIDKVVSDIPDGAIIMCGGFGLCGIPENLIRALVRKNVKELTIISNNLGSIDLKEGGAYGIALLFQNRQVRKFIGSYPGPVSKLDWFKEAYVRGEIKIELMPQGTLNERIRCAGAGLGGVYTPTGVGTVFEDDKEKKMINGREYLLELPLHADYALIKGYKGDAEGNLTYRYTARNYNPVMAPAAETAIAEVEHLVPVGSLDPDHVHTPGIFVQRIIQGEKYEKRA